MQLAQMRQILASRDIQLTKSLGQNFLHDSNILQKIATAARLSPTDRVLEVGPGLGPLTELLIQQSAEVFAIEMDERLLDFLAERWPQEPKLTLLHADALAWLRANHRDWSDWKLVSNLPYSVASPLLIELSEADGPPIRCSVTLQHEVVNRIAAAPDTDDYGLISLLLQLRYTVDGRFRIGADCFFPAPEVESSCITLQRRPVPLLSRSQAATFKRFVKLALSQRRKKMLKLLKQNWPVDQLLAAFALAGVSPDERGEKVSLEQYIILTKAVHVEPKPTDTPPPIAPNSIAE
jgi:16S rRNA (adenine1518-N6/adenine1519-N6)-dimethyltransferase